MKYLLLGDDESIDHIEQPASDWLPIILLSIMYAALIAAIVLVVSNL
jgi:hypothetical protein